MKDTEMNRLKDVFNVPSAHSLLQMPTAAKTGPAGGRTWKASLPGRRQGPDYGGRHLLLPRCITGKQNREGSRGVPRHSDTA